VAAAPILSRWAATTLNAILERMKMKATEFFKMLDEIGAKEKLKDMSVAEFAAYIKKEEKEKKGGVKHETDKHI